MFKLQDIIAKEVAAETMLEAKGFDDVFVRITGDKVDVVVNRDDLSSVELTQIHDIVKRETEVKGENIIITPINKK